MSILLSDLRWYGSANMPEADGVTVGGAIDFTKRIEFADNTAGATQYDAVSSSTSDTATKITWSGRDSSGSVQTQAALTLNGQTKVTTSTLSLERLIAGATTGGAIAGLANPGGTTAVGDIALIARTLTISAHTMQAGSAQATTTNPAVAKLQAGDGATVAVGMVLRTTGGTGPNQIRRILAINPNGLGADFVAVDRNWGTLPDATTTYEAAPGFHFELSGSTQGVAITGTSTQVLALTREFATLAGNPGGGATVTAYEKIFLNNNNQTFAYQSAQIEIASNSPVLPGTAALDIALCKAFNDTATTANRQTLPANGDSSALTFVVQPSFVNVIAGAPAGNLPASAGAGNTAGAQGAWVRATIPGGTTSYKGSPGMDLRQQGTTT